MSSILSDNTPAASVQSTVPVLLDTDIGTDIDDALALAYLLRQPRCELLGITTVTGEPEKRAELADAVCRSLGRENVPIHVGHAQPLGGESQQTRAPQASALSQEWPRRRFTRQPTAVEFLAETIQARPHEITLLCIGPLTNIGILLSREPALADKMKRIVIMGGQITTTWPGKETWAETNIRCDPLAADKVLNAGVPMTVVGYEITMQCSKSALEFSQTLSSGFPLLKQLASQWQAGHADIQAHDPLAATLIFEPSLCRFQSGTVQVELDDQTKLGMTLWHPEEQGIHSVASAVNVPTFFNHYFSILHSQDRHRQSP